MYVHSSRDHAETKIWRGQALTYAPKKVTVGHDDHVLAQAFHAGVVKLWNHFATIVGPVWCLACIHSVGNVTVKITILILMTAFATQTYPVKTGFPSATAVPYQPAFPTS